MCENLCFVRNIELCARNFVCIICVQIYLCLFAFQNSLNFAHKWCAQYLCATLCAPNVCEIETKHPCVHILSTVWNVV